MLKDLKDPNYRMPAEWEKQKSTWIAWPHNQRDWPNKFEFIPFVFCEVISKISNYQKINILIENQQFIWDLELKALILAFTLSITIWVPKKIKLGGNTMMPIFLMKRLEE